MASSPRQLAAAARALVDMPADRYAREAAAAAEYVERYLRPVDDDGLRSFERR